MKDAGNSTVLSGALNGRSAFGRLLPFVVAEPNQPEPLFLDFGGIEVATASYLRESVLALRDVIRGRDSTSIRLSRIRTSRCATNCWSWPACAAMSL